jgi:tetratricopeptide (TPR) repeat protein
MKTQCPSIRAATVLLLAFPLFPSFAVAAQTPMTQGKVEIVSLLGVRHYAQVDTKNEIKAAEIKVLNDPKNVELLIALGRAQANVWQYHDAIDTYSRATRIAPDNALLYRHRGHRYISIREFDKALKDLKRAAQLNDHDYDIWYHLGLAYYLKGEFASAAEAYKSCLAVAEKNAKDDSIIAVSDWLYMTYRRMKKEAEAKQILDRITPDMKVVENKSYFDRLLFYKGLKTEAELVNLEKATDLEIATVGYGLGNWYLYNGNPAKAEEYFRRIVAGRYWPAFGFIAAEVELARKGKR